MINTEKKKEMFLAALIDSMGNISESCKAVQISRQTFYNWIEKDGEFKRKVDEVNESLIDFAETQLMKKIKEGDTTALIFFLKTKGKTRGYSEKPDVEVNVNAEKINKVQVEFIE